MAGEWTLPGIGDDLMSSAKFGERRLKVESSLANLNDISWCFDWYEHTE